MKLSNEQRIAVCCILLDVEREMAGSVFLNESRHYMSLQDQVLLSESDFRESAKATVLASLAIVGELHYKVKMLIGMTVYDLYSRNNQATIQQKTTFSLLMHAINWPIAFSEIDALP